MKYCSKNVLNLWLLVYSEWTRVAVGGYGRCCSSAWSAQGWREREREGASSFFFGIIKSHFAHKGSAIYQPVYATGWHSIGDDPFGKMGHNEIPPIIRASRLDVGRAQAKNLLTHALWQPLLPAFVRNEAYSAYITLSWTYGLHLAWFGLC